MATLTGNPWMVDATGTYTLPARAKLISVRWVRASTAGHRCVITDGDGGMIWESVAAGANYVESDTIQRQSTYASIIMSQLDSGVVYLEHD